MFFLILFPISIVVLYWYGTKNFSYWKKRGVKHNPPLPFVGNNVQGYLMQKSMTSLYDEVYQNFPAEKVAGFYRSTTPELVIRDPEMVKQVLVTDFSYFYKRDVQPNTGPQREPLLMNLFNLDGDLWRLLRQRMTPAFSTGKLKAMFPLIIECAEHLQTRLSSSHGQTIDARDLMARFTTDFIGACAFGVDTNSLMSEDSEFRKLGKKLLNLSFKDVVKTILKQDFPNLFKNIRLTEQIEGDVKIMINSVLAARNYAPSGRHDFLDQMLECQSKGLMVGEAIDRFKPDGTPENATAELTDDLIAAQLIVFFVAGFETSSIATSFTLNLLAYHPQVQKKLHEHIDRVLAKYDNKLSYESVKDMYYLEWSLKEAMRIFPSVGILLRSCVKQYTFEEIGLIIDPGTKIVIPVQSLQMDPKYFENPEEFQPERFDPNELDVEKTKFVYLPFGDGPRNCIGSRLGLMQSLAGLAAVLSKFSVEPAPDSVRYPELKGTPTIIQTLKTGLPIIFKERKFM